MNDATPGLESKAKSPKPEAQAAKLAESLAAFQKLTDSKDRHAYFHSHPELRAIFSEANFHSA